MTSDSSFGSSGRLISIPPDGGWGWVVVVGSFFIHVVTDGFVYSLGILVDVLMEVCQFQFSSIFIFIRALLSKLSLSISFEDEVFSSEPRKNCCLILKLL
ncbi:unnamed protein product [Strongylus vulgaris]|uniref:Uncharacterized protein n=1 Tax=Strongylus vulgaris TaxID=40348 RepID=A0A3P7IW62_STRVU|nr:unnamed protein product [Strongylus vulgaris]